MKLPRNLQLPACQFHRVTVIIISNFLCQIQIVLCKEIFLFPTVPVKQIVCYVGPGQYEVHESDARGGLMTTRQQRFQPQKSETPGPGSYEVKQKIKIKNGLTGKNSLFQFYKVQRQTRETKGSVDSLWRGTPSPFQYPCCLSFSLSFMLEQFSNDC